MWLKGLKETWPLQRLVRMLNHTQTREKDTWKQSPLSQAETRKDIGPDDRDKAIRWIAELTIMFHFHPETFFLASSILDRFITSVKAQPKYLKCIAISCFYLASKITEEEDVVPCTGELVEDSNCGCRVCDVLRMERIILEKLSWDLNSSTSLDYLHIFEVLSFTHYTDMSSSIPVSHHIGMMTNLLIHALCHYQVAGFPNAAIALALVSLELESIMGDPGKWMSVTGHLQSLAKVKTADLMTCRDILRSCVSPTSIDGLNKPHIYLLQQSSLSNPEAKANAKVIQVAGSSGAVKRKATMPTQSSHCELSKKPHPNTSSVDMETEAYDSDKTLTASEGEEESEFAELECDEPDQRSAPARPRTYAEIVKYGLSTPPEQMDHQDSDDSASSSSNGYATNMATRCGFQAACGFGSPSLAAGPPSRRGIRT